jgi:DNA polymerase elongation subunit (family B)
MATSVMPSDARPPLHYDASKELSFNVVDIFGEDDKTDGAWKYTIQIFGVTAEGCSVCAHVTGFKPHFYLQAPPGVRLDVRTLTDALRERNMHFSLDKITEVRKKNFWGYRGGSTEPFFKLSFKGVCAMKGAARYLGEDRKFGMKRCALFESNIEPFLRFCHAQDIRPAGWVTLTGYRRSPVRESRCQLDVSLSWEGVVGVPSRQEIAPLIVASFDIECFAYDGGFPVPARNCSQAIRDFLTASKAATADASLLPALSSHLQAMVAAGRLVLKRPGDMGKFADFLGNGVGQPAAFMTSILAGDMVYDDADGQLYTKKGALPPMSEPAVANFSKYVATHMPMVQGDPAIMVGTTVTRYGAADRTPSRYMFVLGECAPLENAVLRSYATEREMLMGWAAFIRDLDPDVMLGHNILGFDYAYLKDRALEWNCEQEFAELLNRMQRECRFKVSNLSSAALGMNEMRFYPLEGRVAIDTMKVVQRDHKLDSYKLDHVAEHFLKDRKHDLPPQEIFRLYRGGRPEDVGRIADYCLQDCALLNRLCDKLEILANNIGMANVCSVPLGWIFMRGQGVKIFSLVAKQTRLDGFLVPVVRYREVDGDAEGYEGAIVLDTEPRMYLDDAITVLDYASLYPSSMISENISHDTIVLDEAYGALEGREYTSITYDEYAGKGKTRRFTGTKTCSFVQGDAHMGVLPRILGYLLKQRALARKKARWETLTLPDGSAVSGCVSKAVSGHLLLDLCDGSPPLEVPSFTERRPTFDDFGRAVLDGLQLAYKVTANSLYGQMGAPTSPMYMKELAASTTAVGRDMILKAKSIIEASDCRASVIYGDTDSLFVRVPSLPGASPIDKVARAIEVGKRLSKEVYPHLKRPHDFEYEKVLYPFIILSKKRYVGNVYEHDPTSFHQSSKGIVLKRRDNANIVKTVYGGCINLLLGGGDVGQAAKFCTDAMRHLVAGRYGVEELVITKTLRTGYKEPDKIAHKVLADRVAERDPGNRFQSNDRVPYVYVRTDKKDALQGERIETVDFMRQAGLEPDYKFYITNQIQQPVQQLLAIVVESLPGYDREPGYWTAAEDQLRESGMIGVKLSDKLETLRCNDVERLIFNPILIELGSKVVKRKAVQVAAPTPTGVPSTVQTSEVPKKKPRSKKLSEDATGPSDVAPKKKTRSMKLPPPSDSLPSTSTTVSKKPRSKKFPSKEVAQ